MMREYWSSIGDMDTLGAILEDFHMSKLPSVTIIVLNWNGYSYLDACLDALLNQTHKPDQIILVDNGSTDDSLELVQERFPSVDIQRNEINLGYAGGNNSALRHLESEVGVLVNPDIVARPDWLEKLLWAIAENPKTGIAGCKLLFPSEQKLQHAGGAIIHPRAIPAHREIYKKDEGQLDDLEDVEFVTGAALAVRREMIETVGLLDEGFFMYFEDADWCARARRYGFPVVYVPDATAIHDESAFSVRGSPSYLRRFHGGRWRYLLKHFDPKEIVELTLPAEANWLEQLEGEERRALGWAYRDTLKDYPAIMEARVAHGAAEISPLDQKTISAGLLNLRKDAMLWAKNPELWQSLAEFGQINPQPFTSITPVLGPLFARLRDIWAGVSVKPYIGGLNNQQNAFNQSFLEELQNIEERLRGFEAVWMQQEAEQRQLSREIKALQQELNKAFELLARIQSHLE
jgi:GT2 family glycosyltransferase